MTSRQRLTEIDALRGVAAILVVLFHYTTRFEELFGHTQAPAFSVPWGHLGVNLFFEISGFVIFMTLARTRQPMDFVVSRFSRLYPVYWAAVLLTFLVVGMLGLPGKEVGLGTALANLSMVHSLFGVPNVDGVYWTLEVELIFYTMAFVAYRLRLLPQVHVLLLLLFGVRLLYWGFAQFLHIDLPWMISRLLMLKYIPWFAAGIMVYRLALQRETPRRDLALLAAAALLQALVDSAAMAALLLALAGVLYCAATGRLPFLNHPLFAGLGAISYTLYLVHENIGWALILRMERAGLDPNLAIAIATVLALAVSAALTLAIERPAMAWIRRRYKERAAARTAPGAVSE